MEPTPERLQLSQQGVASQDRNRVARGVRRGNHFCDHALGTGRYITAHQMRMGDMQQGRGPSYSLRFW